MFYTDVDKFKNKILVRGYDDEGKRFQKEVAYRPYLFVPSKKKTEFTTVTGEPVERLEFESMYEAKDFIKRYKDVSNFNIYGMDRFVYPYIYDNYPGTIRYDVAKIKVMALDIEVDSQDGFPDLELANREVTAIAFRIGNQRTVLGLKEFDKSKLTRIQDPENIHYYQMLNEKALLMTFLKLWEAADIDVVTGWNIEFFDIPYLIRRMRQVLNEEVALRISPWHRILEKEVPIRGRNVQCFYPMGISILDYQELYRKFTYSQRESYSLNFIAHYELGVKKMDYSEYENLADLYNKNPQLYYEYNIIDVDLIFDLDDKLRLIELIYAIAYDAKVNYTDAMGSVLLWDVIIMNYLMERNVVVDPHRRKPFRAFEGAYVKDTRPGMYDWVVSFDLTSLYPHLIMQYNISPETFEGKDPHWFEDYSIEKLIKDPIDFHNQQVYGQEDKGISRDDTCAVAANGCYYSKQKLGFLPALMDLQFKLRTDYKNKMLEVKKQYANTKDPELEKEISRWNNAQMAKKIQLNSLYGALANEWFRWYDPDHAEAITYSGQLSIRWIAEKVNEYLNKLLKTNKKDYIIAIDTDSIYVNFGPLVKEVQPKSPIDFLDKVAKEKIEPFMQRKYDELAFNMNAYANKMFMKREAIADKAIWRAKKNYVAHVWDNEGVRFKEPELKTMGIEAVRSSTPAVCREKIKEAIRLIVTKDEQTVQEYIRKFREEFRQMPFEDIAFPRSVKKLSKYRDGRTIYISGTPIHAKASLLYNELLRRHKLSRKYSVVFDMDKIKWVYLKQPNPIHEEVIAAPSMLPREFGLDKYIDYDLMFDKAFLDPIKSILDVIGWEVEKTSSLADLFG